MTTGGNRDDGMRAPLSRQPTRHLAPQPSGYPDKAGQTAHHGAKGVKVARRSPLHRGQSSTPKHTAASISLSRNPLRIAACRGCGSMPQCPRSSPAAITAAPDYLTANAGRARGISVADRRPQYPAHRVATAAASALVVEE